MLFSFVQMSDGISSAEYLRDREREEVGGEFQRTGHHAEKQRPSLSCSALSPILCSLELRLPLGQASPLCSSEPSAVEKMHQYSHRRTALHTLELRLTFEVLCTDHTLYH